MEWLEFGILIGLEDEGTKSKNYLIHRAVLRSPSSMRSARMDKYILINDIKIKKGVRFYLRSKKVG
ncbi:hypothetical protein PGT21_011434 [Puccinia graminis f. sp. tritici]|uniref:Uncharacterized protein n=1 Tax=Puccinia graminis f. sp. tritici TaxID=56615 RepID=A0A5B0QMU3_PUCGR|nr:hypothetical protein PGT21_011434 [Puccinia graminis f. sp. tritici]